MPKLCAFDREARTIGARNRLLGNFLPIETSWFKTVFQARRGQKIELALFAASRYCLYVNGQMLYNGPQKGDKNTAYVDRVDIAEALRDGENVISVKVTSYPPVEAYVNMEDLTNEGPYGVTGTASGPCLMVVSGGDGPELSTGYADWRVLNDRSIEYTRGEMGFIMGGNERVTASKMSPHTLDSCMAGFEKPVIRWVQRSGVSTALAPFALYERTLPSMLLEPERGFERFMSRTEPGCEPINLLEGPVELAPNGRYAIDLDAGVLRTAYLLLSMSGGAGARVDIKYTEAYSKLCHEGAYPHPVKGRRDDCENYDFIGLVDTIYPDGRAWTYQTFWFRTFRFVRLVVETADAPLSIQMPLYRVTRYPLNVEAKIAPEQDWMAGLWDISVRTLELCMHETHEDCPFYEQLQYILDTRLQMLFTYAISGDTRMARRVIFDFHASLLPEGILQSRYPSTQTQVIPCFALSWIGMLEDYYQQTGDDSLLRRYRTTMESVLEWFGRKRGESGLAERLGYWEFFDWPPQWGPGYGEPNAVLNEGISTAENMVYAYFLGVGANILERIGRTQDADIYRRERAQLLDAIQKRCWDEARGLYREGPTTWEYSQHAQYYAVLNELVTGEAAVELMRKTLEDETLIQATFPLEFDLFRALDKVGMYEQTSRLWPKWRSLLDEGLTTIPEVPGNQTRSDCHAWGAQLLYEYPRRILGVYPDAPGFERIGIRPGGFFLGQAEGEVPTPKGKVCVRWRMKDGHFSMQASWPRGVAARITLPDGATVDSLEGTYTVE